MNNLYKGYNVAINYNSWLVAEDSRKTVNIILMPNQKGTFGAENRITVYCTENIHKHTHFCEILPQSNDKNRRREESVRKCSWYCCNDTVENEY